MIAGTSRDPRSPNLYSGMLLQRIQHADGAGAVHANALPRHLGIHRS